MRRTTTLVALTIAIVLMLAGMGAMVYVKATGLRARATPGALETSIARSLRRLAVPRAVRRMANPIPASAEAIAEGRAHFADHCASCHANDGSGNTEMGDGVFPKPPDMATVSQELTDGELFYFIEEGIRFTGMPGWGTGTPDGELASWHLVHFIRHLPRITNDEVEAMEALNPRSPVEIRQEIEEQRFLQGDDAAPARATAPTHGH
jgi:mono/diheme cytochrome c family protein